MSSNPTRLAPLLTTSAGPDQENVRQLVGLARDIQWPAETEPGSRLHAVGEYRALPAFRPVGLDDPYPGQRLCQPGSHPGSYQAAFAKSGRRLQGGKITAGWRLRPVHLGMSA
jgi:hypothetical protein